MQILRDVMFLSLFSCKGKVCYRVLDYEMRAFYYMKHALVVEGNLFYAKLCVISCGDSPVFGEIFKAS